MSEQTKNVYLSLSPKETQEYEVVLDVVRTVVKQHPELGTTYVLNALVATGSEEMADRIEAWSGIVCELDSRDRAATCHGNGPRPDRIIRLQSMEEIVDMPTQ